MLFLLREHPAGHLAKFIKQTFDWFALLNSSSIIGHPVNKVRISRNIDIINAFVCCFDLVGNFLFQTLRNISLLISRQYNRHISIVVCHDDSRIVNFLHVSDFVGDIVSLSHIVSIAVIIIYIVDIIDVSDIVSICDIVHWGTVISIAVIPVCDVSKIIVVAAILPLIRHSASGDK